MNRSWFSVIMIAALLTLPLAGQAIGDPPAQPAAGDVTPQKWPVTAAAGDNQYTVYQPQLDTWDGGTLTAHAAVSVLADGDSVPTFGVLYVTAATNVDRNARTVSLMSPTVKNVSFPSAPDDAAAFQTDLQQLVTRKLFAMPLDKLQSELAITGAAQQASGVPLKNDPPTIVVSQTPALLITVDGAPVWRTVQNGIDRLVNTRALILRDATGTLYLHLFDGYLQATALDGPWSVAARPPAALDAIAASLAQQDAVDLMPGQADETTGAKPSLATSPAPRILVVTAPTELLVIDGDADWQAVPGTNLLYVDNTSANLFREMQSQQVYALVSGRWFRAPGFAGPWEFVPASALPPDFAAIPENSPKENVLASVAGTPQAQEAVVANSIPQTAVVDISKASFTTKMDGAPQLQPIASTPLAYVLNSRTPIIKVADNSWYACEGGVWFTAASVAGPWRVATSVPAVIYSIPPSSPLYYTTFVRIYNVTPTAVVVGYTPGYMGTVVTADGVVVYGTGYDYVAYIGPTYWYPAPVTYGYAAAVTWTPWTSWIVGFGFGWAMATNYWGCAPYWGGIYYPYHPPYPPPPPRGGVAVGPNGAVAWGPGGWAATTGNVYRQNGAVSSVTRSSAGYNAWTGNAWSKEVGRSYNSTTGRISAGEKGSVENVYTGNYAYGKRGGTYNPSTGTGVRGGTVTYGNVDNGQSNTISGVHTNGPQDNSSTVIKGDDNTFASHDGNVYRKTDDGWQKYDNGSWSDASRDANVPELEQQRQARQAGNQRAAGASWGGDWGGSFHNQPAASSSGSWNNGNFRNTDFNGGVQADRSRGSGGGRGRR